MPAPTAITRPNVGDPTRAESFAEAVIDWIEYMNSLTASRDVILNGSFEQDSDSDGIPDGWTRTLQTGGAFVLESSTVSTDDKSIHGKRAVKFTSTGGGNGGGEVETTDFVECAEGKTYLFSWQMKSSAADVKNIVSVDWYDSTQTFISSTSLYNDATANPTTWSIRAVMAEPPADARYFKLTLIGCDSSDSTAGSTWFDDVRVWVFPPLTREVVINQPGTYTWYVPTGVGVFHVQVIGGGGGGGGAGTAGGGGGGGGNASGYYPATAASYDFVVGAGGAGGAGDNSGVAGSDSTFVIGAVTLTGGAGDRGLRGGSGGTGGAGGAATNGNFNSSGSSGSDNAAGTGGIGGFAGGIGVTAVGVAAGDGQHGPTVGAGGSGAATSGNPNNGGNGANGAVIIRW